MAKQEDLRYSILSKTACKRKWRYFFHFSLQCKEGKHRGLHMMCSHSIKADYRPILLRQYVLMSHYCMQEHKRVLQLIKICQGIDHYLYNKIEQQCNNLFIRSLWCYVWASYINTLLLSLPPLLSTPIYRLANAAPSAVGLLNATWSGGIVHP